MTLKDFYNNLPRPVAPKTEFIRRVAERTGRDVQTVRFWVYGQTKPTRESDLSILEEETGLSREDLFQ